MGIIQLDDRTKGMAKSAKISAVVIGADGKVKQDLGTIAYWSKNPLKQLAWDTKQLYKRIKAKFGGSK